MPISLQAANIETITLGGSVVITNDTEAVSQAISDFIGGDLNVTLAQGTPASNAFTTNARAKTHTLRINVLNGQWNTSTGQQGTLGGAALTALQTNQRNLKNALETIANNIGLVSGTVVAWT